MHILSQSGTASSQPAPLSNYVIILLGVGALKRHRFAPREPNTIPEGLHTLSSVQIANPPGDVFPN
jgi:hypothetical protein